MSRASDEEAELISREVEQMLLKGAIIKTSSLESGFYSRIFTVPKKGGALRPVIDLSSLNKFVVNHHFQMKKFIV